MYTFASVGRALSLDVKVYIGGRLRGASRGLVRFRTWLRSLRHRFVVTGTYKMSPMLPSARRSAQLLADARGRSHRQSGNRVVEATGVTAKSDRPGGARAAVRRAGRPFPARTRFTCLILAPAAAVLLAA